MFSSLHVGRPLYVIAVVAMLLFGPAGGRAQAQTVPPQQDPGAACDASQPSDGSSCDAQADADQPEEACDPSIGEDGLQHDCDPSAGDLPPTGEAPAAREKNPPGDIPDSQVFVLYDSPLGGYQLKAPEGWATTATDTDVSFADKLNSIAVTIARRDAAPTAESVSLSEAGVLQQTGRAVEIVRVKDVQLPGGPAVLLIYDSNSDPNPVTGKQYRLENTSFLFFSNGRLATLTLSAPLGADNVDDWRLISRSFGWH